jgi:hypothetical protein
MVLHLRCFYLACVSLWGPLATRPTELAAQRATEQPPVLTSFTIDGGSAVVSATDTIISLTHTVVGARPAEYRVSRRADFTGARWQPYTTTPSVRDWYDANGESCDAARPSHRVVYYLQVRATLGEEVKIADGQRRIVPARVESNVLRATVCAYVPPTAGGVPSPRPLP